MQKFAEQQLENQSSNNITEKNMTRRELLIGIMASVGAVTTAGCVQNFDQSVVQGELNKVEHSDNLRFYTASEYQLISILADLIIPETDTLGALAIGAPKMMDTLYTDWASAESSQKQKKDLINIKQSLDELAGQDFLTVTPQEQVSALTLLDQQAYSAPNSNSWSYRSVKSLIAQFYYSSEVGATQELRYQLVPGRWEACIPFEKVGRTWAA